MLTDEMENLVQSATVFEEMLQKGKGFLPTLLVALLIFLLGLLLTRIVLRVVDRAMRRAKVEGAASSFIKSLLRILLYTLLAIIALSTLGVPMTSIIAVISAAGLAIGLALQDSLSNLAGGFIILFSKPFKAGDYIIADGTEGRVDSVSILYTKLITRDNRSVYLPNGVLSSGQITNLSERGTLRVSVPLSIAYDADLNMARQVVLKVLANEPMVLQDPAPAVSVKGHGDNAVLLNAGFWVNSDDYFAVSGRIYESTKRAFDGAGIEIPYPQLCVHQPM